MVGLGRVGRVGRVVVGCFKLWMLYFQRFSVQIILCWHWVGVRWGGLGTLGVVGWGDGGRAGTVGKIGMVVVSMRIAVGLGWVGVE